MTPEEALSIGFPLEWLPTDLTVEEALINRCEDCGAIIKKYPDAKWRVGLSPCRCDLCYEKMRAKGYSHAESKYVS